MVLTEENPVHQCLLVAVVTSAADICLVSGWLISENKSSGMCWNCGIAHIDFRQFSALRYIVCIFSGLP